MRKIINYMCIMAGCISMVIGIIGIVLPILPTTPFFLLSAFLYAKGPKNSTNGLLILQYIKNIL